MSKMEKLCWVVVGFIVGCFLCVWLVNGPAQTTRERQSYRNGVQDGMAGSFSVKIDTVHWRIVPTN